MIRTLLPLITMTKRTASNDRGMSCISVGKHVFSTGRTALKLAASRLDRDFERATMLIANCSGKVIVIGMGKSGLVGRKISATLSSTLTPSTFMHPVEAYHGDFGMVSSADLVIAISNSGSTKEVLRLLPPLRKLGVPVIALCGDIGSVLARKADVRLDVSVPCEASLTGTVATTSALVAMCMGDALAIAVMESKGLSAKDLERVHPHGALGKKLRNSRK